MRWSRGVLSIPLMSCRMPVAAWSSVNPSTVEYRLCLADQATLAEAKDLNGIWRVALLCVKSTHASLRVSELLRTFLSHFSVVSKAFLVVWPCASAGPSLLRLAQVSGRFTDPEVICDRLRLQLNAFEPAISDRDQAKTLYCPSQAPCE